MESTSHLFCACGIVVFLFFCCFAFFMKLNHISMEKGSTEISMAAARLLAPTEHQHWPNLSGQTNLLTVNMSFCESGDL